MKGMSIFSPVGFKVTLLKIDFPQYRQMNGGRVLVSLWEVLSTERILTCQSLLKQNINFLEENLKPVQKNDKIFNILAQHESQIDKLLLLLDGKEVAYTISGYITNKLNIFNVKCVPWSW